MLMQESLHIAARSGEPADRLASQHQRSDAAQFVS